LRTPAEPVGCKPIRAGYTIDDYTGNQLVQLIRRIKLDDVLCIEDQLLAIAMTELGPQRRGAKIVSALTRPIAKARS
jgi:hypothetical protein